MPARHVSPLESPFSWRHLATSENWADDDGDDEGTTDDWNSACHFNDGPSGARHTSVQSCGSCEPPDGSDGEWMDWNPTVPSGEKAWGSPQEPDSEEEWGKWKPVLQEGSTPDKRPANRVPEPAQPPLRKKSSSFRVPEPAYPTLRPGRKTPTTRRRTGKRTLVRRNQERTTSGRRSSERW
jgi:hypothetical protein